MRVKSYKNAVIFDGFGGTYYHEDITERTTTENGNKAFKKKGFAYEDKH